MIFEHFALNVNNPIEISEWYVRNCEMKVVKRFIKEPFTHFLADKTGRVVVEFYNNPNAEKIQLKNKHPLEFHFAFMVEDAVELKQKLVQAGAKIEEELNLDDGSILIMMRDPFGIPLQLCQRATKLMDL